MSFDLDIQQAPPTATLTGELTIMTLLALQDDLFSLLNFAIVVLDVSQLEALDGCGAQLLALLQQEANQQNKSLRIRIGEESVAQQVLSQLGLLPMLSGVETTNGHK